MDPEEQLCRSFLQNDKINPRVTNKRLITGGDEYNSYAQLCIKYGYDKEVNDLLQKRSLPKITTSNKSPRKLNVNPEDVPRHPMISASQLPSFLPATPTPIGSPKKSPRKLDVEPRDAVSSHPMISASQLPSFLSTTSKSTMTKIIELPEKLWNWNADKNEAPIPISYPVKYRFKLNRIEEWRGIISELSGVDVNLDNFNVKDLQKLFDLYNTHFFNNSLPITKLEISNALTRVAGKCKTTTIGSVCDYTIRISRPIFTKLNLEKDQKTKSGGLICRSRLQCLQLVLEHEMIHLIIRYNIPTKKGLDKRIYSSHGLLFKDLVKNYFGQTESTHQIGRIIYDESDEHKPLLEKDIKVGKMVFYFDKGEIKKGIITAVLIKNVSVQFIDGSSYRINPQFLYKLSDEDEDYDLILDLQIKAKEKLNLFRTTNLNDKVKIDFNGKEVVGNVNNINTKSSKLSVVSGNTIYTVVYISLIQNYGFDNSISQSGQSGKKDIRDKTKTGEYTKEDFRVGDKVIFPGRAKDPLIKGVIIKLNRVNALVKADNGDKWNARYSSIKFQ
jgi:hypothetical protein